MKNLFFFPLILVWVLFTGCRDDELHSENGDNGASYLYSAYKDTEFDNGSSIIFPNINGQLIVDIELLCRIWGFLKYHHPEVGKGNLNWDYELFRMLPQYLQVKTTEERDSAILDWINKYGAIPVCTTCEDSPPNAYIKPDLSWSENSNMNQVLKAKIREIYQNRHQGNHYYIRMENIGNPRFLNENPYSFYYPDAGFRLLTLFRYWNVIHYFFPNKYLTDKNWDDILPDYISLFISANNRLEFEMATLQLIGEIHDTHASFAGGVAIRESRGSYFAPFRVWFVEGKLVVTDYYNPERMDTSVIKIGDVVTHINGETVESIVENRKKYYPASNEATRLRNMSFDLLRSTQNVINISTSGQVGLSIQLYQSNELNRYDNYKVNSNEKCYKLLDGNIGYVTLATITNEDVPAIKSDLINTKGIIIDIRNYPNTFVPFILGAYFVSHDSPFVKFTIGNANNPGEFTFRDGSIIPFYAATFQGKLIVIVNEITQSQAEFTVMAFRAGINTTVIGSTTAGADGNMSSINLPGGLHTWISGLGVYYPDGTVTQRVGIIPDVWVEPTIEGIRKGRDELLETAISLINEE